jgi:hypothetical protein
MHRQGKVGADKALDPRYLQPKGALADEIVASRIGI